MPHPVTAKPKATTKRLKRLKALVAVRDLLIKRPAGNAYVRATTYHRATNRWKAEMKRYGVAKMAEARKRREQRALDRRIGRLVAYAGNTDIKVLVELASSALSAKAIHKILDLFESILKMNTSIQAFATFEHLWPDGSAAVSVHHKEIGWLEFDIPSAGLPQGIQPQDTFAVRLRLDVKGNVVSHQIPPGTKTVRLTEPSIGDMLEARLPQPPKNWDDEADVTRYQRELEVWEKNSGLGKREPQAG